MKNYQSKADTYRAKCGTEVKYIKQPDAIILKSQRDVVLSAGENNDCVVHAVAHAFEFGYHKAHSFCKDLFNREKGKGVFGFDKLGRLHSQKYTDFASKYLTRNTIKEVDSSNTYRVRCEWSGKVMNKKRNMTLKSFLKKYPEGRYIVGFYNHAIAVIDGVVVGNGKRDANRLRRPIEKAYRVS